mgnify:CR=1 FL=1|tara:strand:- start:87713 stop:88624 length:912 start_codon:yes stop_codon:yes gene_type:complete
MQQYHDMLQRIMDHGTDKGDRTGTGTRSVFGHQMRFNLQDGFPLLTTKQTSFKMIMHELLWFIQGNKSVDYLHQNGVHIWDEWMKDDGTFGPIYGHQWRSWPKFERMENGENGEGYLIEDGSIDQLENVINRIKDSPDDRRLIVSAWNVADVEAGNMALPPCHVMFQFYTRPLTQAERARYDDATWLGKKLPERAISCQLYQRSADSFLGVPYNIASYSLLLEMIAHLTNMVADDFIWTGGDTHIYHNHFDQVEELLGRDPNEIALPELVITARRNRIDQFKGGDFYLEGYESMPPIKAPIAV